MRAVATIATFATVAGCFVVVGCGASAPTGTLTNCIEVENGEPRDLTIGGAGQGLPIVGTPVDDADFPTRPNSCKADHSITLETSTDLGRVRFSWASDATDLDVGFAEGDVTVDEIARGWSGGFTFAISDGRGFALAVNTEGFAQRAGPLTITQGAWRSESFGDCGTSSTTNAHVSDGTTTTEIELGDEKVMHAGGLDLTVHPFSSMHLDSWQCSDSQSSLTWSVARH